MDLMVQQNPDRPQWALFDYDGTLIELNHSVFDKGTEFDWEEFMSKSRSCPVIERTLDMMKALQAHGYVCAICTARPEQFLDDFIVELTERELGEDIVIMRDTALFEAEVKALEGLTDPVEIKRVVFEQHAIFRQAVVDDLNEQFGEGTVGFAFDDQPDNLDVFMNAGASCHLVKDGNIHLYNTFTKGGF